MPGSIYSSGADYIFFLRERHLKYIRFSQCYTFLYFLEDDSSKKLTEEIYLIEKQGNT